jgi:alpha-beta hydrolase superfamily lysophospholipase
LAIIRDLSRGKLRYYRNRFGMRERFEVPSIPFEARAADGVRIAGAELPARSGREVLSYLVVHGLVANHLAPGFRHFAESLTRYGSVWTIDLRGHGRSEGVCTLGDREALDVAAATGAIRAATGHPLVAVGFSMGAGAAVRAAALYEKPDAVVSVSGPARWGGWRGPGARRTSKIWRLPGGPLTLRVITGVRIARPSLEGVESPAEVAARVAPAPLMVVHGDSDEFFPPEEARDLYEAAREPKLLWMVEDGGHAEGLFTVPGEPVEHGRVDAFVDELTGRVRSLLGRPDPAGSVAG